MPIDRLDFYEMTGRGMEMCETSLDGGMKMDTKVVKMIGSGDIVGADMRSERYLRHII